MAIEGGIVALLVGVLADIFIKSPPQEQRGCRASLNRAGINFPYFSSLRRFSVHVVVVVVVKLYLNRVAHSAQRLVSIGALYK